MEFDTADLEKTVGELEVKLSGTPASDTDLTKSLAEVANKALDVAKGRKAKRRAADLAKAEMAKKKDDAEDEDEEEEEMPDWLKNIIHDGKGEGDMVYAKDREDTGMAANHGNAGGEKKGMAKALQMDGLTAVDVEGYLREELGIRTAMVKAMQKSRKRAGTLQKGVGTLAEQLYAQGQQIAVLCQAVGILAKGMGRLIDTHDSMLDMPMGGSKFGTMEKSLVAVREHMEANGAQRIKYDKTRASDMLLKGQITNAAHLVWKKTGYLPADVQVQ
jgi:regulator of replication initiation timing